MTEPAPYFFAGEQIADVQLIRPLRVRALSECWLAAGLADGASCAVKFLRRENPHAAHFHELADFLEHSNSPFLIRVLRHAETAQGMQYAVMEFADGGSLRRKLDQSGKLSLPNAVFLLRGMLQALASLHADGIVHRDVKPDNIWLTSDGGFRLGDLGLAKLPGVAEERGKVFGTASFLSPEQAQDSSSADARSDLYSLALVLFEALTGSPLRPKGPFVEMVKRIRSDRSAPPVALLRESATEKLAVLLSRMMEFSPALRPQSAAEALAGLNEMNLPEETLF